MTHPVVERVIHKFRSVVNYIALLDSREPLIRDLLDLPLNPRRVDLRSSARRLGFSYSRNDRLGRGRLLCDGGSGSGGDGDSSVGALGLFGDLNVPLGSGGRRGRGARGRVRG
jgi:hypothetical protein